MSPPRDPPGDLAEPPREATGEPGRKPSGVGDVLMTAEPPAPGSPTGAGTRPAAEGSAIAPADAAARQRIL